jgi:hypothetical protein
MLSLVETSKKSLEKIYFGKKNVNFKKHICMHIFGTFEILVTLEISNLLL